MIKKMKNGAPKNVGKINGKYVSIHPNLLNIIYCGIITISKGNINVSNIHTNQRFLPINRILENPYAIIVEDITLPNVAINVIIKEFLKNVEKEIPANPSHPTE